MENVGARPMILRVIDLETTGFPPDAGIVEIGWCDVVKTPASWLIGGPQAMLTDPQRLIEWQAMAIHHITDDDVSLEPPASEVLPDVLAGGDVYVSHRASFERAFIPDNGRPWICTWKVAIKFAPKAPGHSNQILRYWLKLDVNRDKALPPHRAGPDAYVTAHLLLRMLGKLTVEEMIEITAQPAILPYFVFGKHAMQQIETIPSGYLEWIIKQEQMDPDAQYTARHHLEQRLKPRAAS